MPGTATSASLIYSTTSLSSPPMVPRLDTSLFSISVLDLARTAVLRCLTWINVDQPAEGRAAGEQGTDSGQESRQ